MQLTKEQIQDLYQFTKQHYVEWYDLQTELVDHLANDIEHILEQEPHLTFNQAKEKAFKKFGVFGFMDIVEQKQKQLDKRYWKMMLNELIHFFSIPKIAISFSLIFALYYAFYYLKVDNVWFFILVIIFSVYPIYYSIKYRKALNKKYKKTGKKYLFEEYIFSLGGLASGFILPLQVFLNIKSIHQQTTAIF
jgi:hypothetical protein